MAEGSGEVVAVSATGAANGLNNGAGGTSATTSNPLSRKLHKILETRLDNDKEMLEALKALSTFFVENSLRTRRNLRGDIERKSLAINEEFVSIFKEVKEELESISEDVQAMSNCCQDMTSRLQAAKEQTQDLIVKTTKLQSESQKLEIRAQVADAFLSKFQLTSDEMSLLRGTREGPITEDFFKALGRVKQIHNDVKVLLRTNQQTAGLEIMEQMALLQETAYERLYRWAQSECRTLTQESCDVSPVLTQAMEALQDRPVLYKYTLDEFGTARRSTVVRGFIDALTRGGPGGTPRPIEMHSHDPLRYVGDMLAWLHQATASEKEHLEALLKHVTTQGVEENIQEVVGHITEGVCRPLKVELPPPDLGPSSALNQTLMLLREVLASHDSSVVPLDARQADFVQVLSCVLDPLLQMCTVSASNLGTADMATFMVNSLYMMKTTLALFEFTDRRLEMLQFQIEAHLDTLINEQASYVLTRVGLSYIYNTVQQHKPEQGSLANMPNLDSVTLKAAMVQFDRYLSAPDNLLIPQLNFLLSATVKPSADWMEPAPLTVNLLHSVFQLTCQSPVETPSQTHPEIMLYQLTREQIVKQSTELVCRAYGEVYAAVMNPINEYKDPENILHRSPQQVQTLLS
ncbi:conserved oligomeric Golgi complex subunit 6 isoform X3 [Pan troglodytes]|uniref:conserved oligomeric Golgi complex subunit 6 isoform X3 n=1 Tax=Pan troglodytes TaxID=9598 RepID=UPI0023F41937|nr:conserved oligomeric Golgi complex subunit 6 isoform X3 [Pan troglodytes]